jgi:haloalkane dehalogenase
METLRTPDDRFVDLPDYDFGPNYAEVDDYDGGSLRVHYLDEGLSTASPVVLLHGEPTWSYLYRHMIGPLADAGHRVIVPDLPGFGRSDKPVERSDYTYARLVGWMQQLLVDHLAIEDATLFGQDWGGLVGLRVVASAPDRFAGVVIGNTGLPTGSARPAKAFLAWQHFSQTTDDFPVGQIISGGCQRRLSPAEIAAYDAPFPDDRFKAGARVLPTLVPTSNEDPAAADNQRAWEVLESYDRPFLCAFSDADPITAGGDKPFRERIPGARGQPHTTIEGGGHFLQEDRPVELADVVNRFIASSHSPGGE